MTNTPTQALAAAARQAAHGPKFGTNECKKQTRLLYGVDSDGSQTAAIAWTRTDVRRAIATDLPKGTLIWWLGGTNGAGHVAIYAGGGKVWSTDIYRSGFFDLVPLELIVANWPKLRLAGSSYDIDGVRVVPEPAPAKPVAKDNRVTRARALLREAIKYSGPIRARMIKAGLAILPKD